MRVKGYNTVFTIEKYKARKTPEKEVKDSLVQ